MTYQKKSWKVNIFNDSTELVFWTLLILNAGAYEWSLSVSTELIFQETIKFVSQDSIVLNSNMHTYTTEAEVNQCSRYNFSGNRHVNCLWAYWPTHRKCTCATLNDCLHYKSMCEHSCMAIVMALWAQAVLPRRRKLAVPLLALSFRQSG